MKDIQAKINSIFENYVLKFIEKNENIIFNSILKYVFLENPGKRLRPIMSALFAQECFQFNPGQIKNFLIAIEMIHNYTLVHDDLPAIDNDMFRRGLPSVHAKFGEYNAILFGDALQSEAFRLFSEEENFENFDPKVILKVINNFSKIIGQEKLIYGQILDLDYSKENLDNKEPLTEKIIEKIHKNKTAELFAFCSSFGAFISNQNEQIIEDFFNFGLEFGLAFQIFDDIEDFQDSKKKELNILNFLKFDEVKILLEKKILYLENFIERNEIIKNKNLFYELVTLVKIKT